MSLPRLGLLSVVLVLWGCTPATYIEEAVEQDPMAPRALNTLLLIAAAAEDSARRAYENRCDSQLGKSVHVISSHEIWPDINTLNRNTVETWLAQQQDIDGVLVVQLAALEQSRAALPQGGVATRELELMVQPGLTWNYQPDPSTTLPDQPTVLTQASLYVMPEGKLTLTVMSRSNVEGKLTSLFRSHCDTMITELQSRHWLP